MERAGALEGRGPQEQEVAGPVTRGAAIVDDAAKGLEERRRAVDFVDDDERSRQGAKKGIGICEPTLIRGALQVEIDGSSCNA